MLFFGLVKPSTADFSLLRWTAPNEAASQRSPTKSTSRVTWDLSCWARLSVSVKPIEHGTERRLIVKVLDSAYSHAAFLAVSHIGFVCSFFSKLQLSIVATSTCQGMAAWMVTWQRFPTKFSSSATAGSIFWGRLFANAKPTELGVAKKRFAEVILGHDEHCQPQIDQIRKLHHYMSCLLPCSVPFCRALRCLVVFLSFERFVSVSVVVHLCNHVDVILKLTPISRMATALHTYPCFLSSCGLWVPFASSERQ